MASIEAALATAQRFGTRASERIAGVLPSGVDRAMRSAPLSPTCARPRPSPQHAGVLLLVENINTTDMPGYFADTAERAATLVEAVEPTQRAPAA